MVTGRPVARGDVWWAESPLWNRRPVVVLTRESVVDRLSSLSLALVTTTIRGLPTEVALDEEDGMPRTCVVNLDNVATQHRSVLVDHITRLSAERMDQVCDALAIAHGC